ncbi:MAG: alpha/beta fold hydrolase [Gammaproteobacteria bacterium]|nr:alpha/beta fold hydrolase [Gammaproteobacteria bacterium]
MRSLLKHVVRLIVYGAPAVLLTLIVVYVFIQQRRPDLELWHLVDLDADFTASQASEITTLQDYLEMEAALFQQLDEQVFAAVPLENHRRFLRFSAGSQADPRNLIPDWNRTVKVSHRRARGAALLLHGLSDSPYSLRSIAGLLSAQGLNVLTIRLPGHGTTPSGLLRSDHLDWMAAVRLGMRHLAENLDEGQPLFIVGYSTGASLAVEYAAARLLGEDLPPASGLILLSPAIGVSPLAAFAVWQSRLALLPGLQKLAWTDILPEYDPYKYNSFTANAGDQVYRLTQRVAAQLDALGTEQGVTGMPPILAFQSVVDATVSAPAVLNTLFLQLAPDGHELVAFDINRHADIEPFIKTSTLGIRSRFIDGPTMPVDFTLVANANSKTDRVVSLRRDAGSTVVVEAVLDLAWPSDVYSLSHIALPFAPDDPIYGAVAAEDDRIFLGRMDARGERGMLILPAASLLRLRYNPFYSYVESRVTAFLETKISDERATAAAQHQP